MIDNVVLNSIVILMEIMIMINCFEISFKTGVLLSRYLIVEIMAVYIIYMAVNFGILSQLWTIIVYILILIYCHFQFKHSWLKTIVKTVIGFTICILVEVISTIIIFFIFYGFEKEQVLFFSMILAFMIVRVLRGVSFRQTEVVSDQKISIWFVTALYVLTLVFLLLDYYVGSGSIKMYTLIIICSVFFIFIYFQKEDIVKGELEKKKQELQLHDIYGSGYEELLKELRMRQHDFKNQLGAIYSMHMVAESLEELIIMQREYANNLQLNAKHYSIVISCNNKILAGYLSERCSLCESRNISVEADIRLNRVECCFMIHEIIEILGILIDNACENIMQVQMETKRIRIKAHEDKKKITFAIANPVQQIDLMEVDKMFQYGYSSKGTNRGIGLARVSELVKKHKAKIIVSPFITGEEEWIEFIVEISQGLSQ